jgi:hypothetical protein
MTGSGYEEEQIMEPLLGTAQTTISKYLDHIFPAPVDFALPGASFFTPKGE